MAFAARSLHLNSSRQLHAVQGPLQQHRHMAIASQTAAQFRYSSKLKSKHYVPARTLDVGQLIIGHRLGSGTIGSKHSDRQHSRPYHRAGCSASSTGAVADTGAYTWPWLPAPKAGLPAEHIKTQFAWLASLIAGVSIVFPLLAAIAYIHLNEAIITSILGSKLQTLFLLAWPVLHLAAYMPAFVQHEYEGHQAATFDTGTAVDRSTHLNSHLHVLTTRFYATVLSFSMLAFSAAVLGPNNLVVATALLSSILFCGPYEPVLFLPFPDHPTPFTSATTVLGLLPAYSLYTAALWHLFGAMALIPLGLFTVGGVLEVSTFGKMNQWLHGPAHLLQMSVGAVLLFLLMQRCGVAFGV